MSASVARLARLPPLPSPKELLRLYKVHALKSLSQNFLLDPKLTSKFVSMAGKIRGSYVCEVGPGPGNITRSILHQHPNHVMVVEKDSRFLPALSLLQEASGGKLSIVNGDILGFDMSRVFPEECLKPWHDVSPKIHLLGNLPFNVSLPLIIRWLHAISLKTNAWRYGRVKMTLTVQEEVAVRMTAPVGHPERCRFSVMCQNWCEIEHKFTIPGKAFIPKPKVNVAVVTLVPLVKPHAQTEFKRFEKMIRTIFNTRRKQCKFGVKLLFPLARRTELAEKLFAVADVDPTISAFNLSMIDFERLAHTYTGIVEQYPSLDKYNYRGKNSEEDFFD